MPFSAVIVSGDIVDSFRGEKRENPPFLHSHTYSGNAIGVSLALATLEILQEDFSWGNFEKNTCALGKAVRDLEEEFECVTNSRNLGMIAAFDVTDSQKMPLFQRMALERGLLLRPLRNTVYWVPPLVTNQKEIADIKKITRTCLHKIYECSEGQYSKISLVS